MRKAVFSLAVVGFVVAMSFKLTAGGWMLNAANAFLITLAWSLGMDIVRSRVGKAIGTAVGDDTGPVSFAVYVAACFVAIAVATICAAVLPHSGLVTMTAVLGVLLVGVATDLIRC
jgi:hypothetical protein